MRLFHLSNEVRRGNATGSKDLRAANHFALKYKRIVKANIAAMKELRMLKNQSAVASGEFAKQII